MMTATEVAMGANEESSGGRLVSARGPLPLLGVRLTARAGGGVARAVLEQRFRNAFAEPLRVTYLFPLPHDGAVSGFAFTIGGKRVVGEIDRRNAARERFEEAIASGRAAGIVDQERGSLFTQELGNVPPGAEIVAELTVDQKLTWHRSGSWEWRFPTSVAPRYQGAPGRVGDAGRIQVDVVEAPIPARITLDVAVADAIAEGRDPESPSHSVAFRQGAGLLRASLADEDGAPLDRDIVVRWPVASPAVGVSLAAFRPASGPLSGSDYGLLTVVPPTPEARPPALPRDVIVLLDTSGSMAGEPLDQARRIASALVDYSLQEGDRLEMIAFSTEPRSWKPGPVYASAGMRQDAIMWLRSLEAGGGTEMRQAVTEALRSLRRDAQRQVVLVTDGQIGFEREVVAEVLQRLPAGSRLHTVGVGSAVNRSLTASAARAGRGVEVVVGIGEDPERAAQLLRARTECPLVTELQVSGSAVIEHAPARLPDLFAGAPALVPLRLRQEGGEIRVSGATSGGKFERTLRVAPAHTGAGETGLAALFGREAVEDLEMRLAAGEAQAEIDRAVEKLGLDFQIATRLTSWVAVSEEPAVDPTKPTRRVKAPQQLPHGMSVERLGLRAAAIPVAPAISAMPLTRRVPTLEPEPEEALEGGEESPVRACATVAWSSSEPVSAESHGPGEPTRLAGWVTLERDGRLVVEVSIVADLAWKPPDEIGLLFVGDGKARKGRLIAEQSTAPGMVLVGQTLRLAVQLDDPATSQGIVVMTFEMNGAPVSVVAVRQ